MFFKSFIIASETHRFENLCHTFNSTIYPDVGFDRFIFVAVDQVNGLMELCDKLPVPGVVTRDFQDREATWLPSPKTDSCYVAAVRGPSGAGPAGDQLEGTIRWASLFATPPDFLA